VNEELVADLKELLGQLGDYLNQLCVDWRLRHVSLL